MAKPKKATTQAANAYLPVPVSPKGDSQLRAWFEGKDPKSLAVLREV